MSEERLRAGTTFDGAMSAGSVNRRGVPKLIGTISFDLPSVQGVILRRRFTNTRSDAPQRSQAGEIHYKRGHHPPACADRLPAQRDDQPEMDGGGQRGELLAVRGQQGG